MPISYNKKIRLIFMGTPDFALPGLKTLITSPDFNIVGVFTSPDKPIGRHQILTPPAVKRLAVENNLAIFQPHSLKNEIANIQRLNPDLIVVIAYGKIIPPEILKLPRFGGINVHASLLPKYRGAACLNAPILNGDQETGITIMKMDAGLDTGPILRQAKIQLTDQENLEKIRDRLSQLGAKLLIPTLKDFMAGDIKPQIQEETKASYVKIINKEDGRIDWKKSALEIERMVRAYNPWPGTYSTVNKKILKIKSVENKILENNKHKIGKIFLTENKLAVQCGTDSLIISELQMAGKKVMTAKNFLSGHQNIIGKILQ